MAKDLNIDPRLFWKYVDASGGPDACWPWMKTVEARGYGVYFVSRVIDGKKRWKKYIASRAAYELTNGPLGDLFALHRCDNRRCCNPNHLFAGTAKDNWDDRHEKMRAGTAIPYRRTGARSKNRPKGLSFQNGGRYQQPRKPFDLSIDPKLFWQFVDKSGGPDACWPWRGGLSTYGYGIYAVSRTAEDGKRVRRRYVASRAAYELTTGPLGKLQACHRCDNPACCNPGHMFPGTAQDNIVDHFTKVSAGTRQRKKAVVPPNQGEWLRSVTAEQATEMRRLRAETGMIYREIAERFGVDRKTAERICKGETYSNVATPEVAEPVTPKHRWQRRVEVNGVEYPSLHEAARALDMTVPAIWQRLKRGSKTARYLD